MQAWCGVVATVAAFGCGAAAAAGIWLARGSTAVPAGWWAVTAAGAIGLEMGVRAAGGLADPAAALAARLAGVALTCCPAMALLGAKRPQHRVWQAIVASLAVVLAMPAVSASVLRPGMPPDVHPLERGLLGLLLAVGWMNFAGTRHGVAASLIFVGQVIFARPVLPLLEAAAGSDPRLETAGVCLAAAGAGLALVQSALLPARSPGHGTLAATLETPFLALRESLGAAWALRIAERFNQLAALRGWPCRLAFRGLEMGRRPADPAADAAWQRDAVRAFGALARRFATPAWIARHSGEGGGDSA